MSDKLGAGRRGRWWPLALGVVLLAVMLPAAAAQDTSGAVPAQDTPGADPAQDPSGAVPAQDPSGAVSNERIQVILGELTRQPDAYDTQSGILKPIITLESSALIPGLPVRQQPVNVGKFQTAGCSQCHRLAGPLPTPNDAPRDVFSQLHLRAATAAPPAGFTRLTTAASEETTPLWSPDGRSILYDVRAADGSWSLWRMDADGSAQQRLTTQGNAGWANWSPDGSRIVYWQSDARAHSALWLMNADGSGKQRLTDSAMVAFPVWSPDGRAIAYQTRSDTGDWHIDLLRVADGSVTPLTPPGQSSPSRPQWSPDGREIAYQVADGGAFGLWRLTFPLAPGGAPDYAGTPQSVPGSTLLPMDIGQAKGNTDWSPAGGRLMVQMPALVTVPTGQLTLSYKTWVTNPDGTEPSLLVPTQTLADRDPTWSPDGAWIAQWSWNPDLKAAVWLVRPDGTGAVDLTAPLDSDALAPDWSPDGSKIAFSSDRAGHFDIWVADLAVAAPGFRP